MLPPVLFLTRVLIRRNFASYAGSSWQHPRNRGMLRPNYGNFVAVVLPRVMLVTSVARRCLQCDDTLSGWNRGKMHKTGSMTPQSSKILLTGRCARVQYHILMALYRIAVNRYLYGIFARGLGRVFPQTNAAFLPMPGGSTFKIYLHDAYWTRFALFHSNYEPEVRHVIDAAAGHTPLFCDLGANKGYWSVYAASAFPDVLAVEASQATYAQLIENVGNLTNVTPRRAAVFSTSGQKMTFVNTYQSHASARLSPDGHSGARDIAETVRTCSVDDLVPPGTAALIKLDVEGAEIAAIDGATRALAEGSVLIYEDHGADATCAPSAHLLGVADISLYCIGNTANRVSNISAIRALKTDRYNGYNFLAARTDSPLLAAIVEAFAKP